MTDRTPRSFAVVPAAGRSTRMGTAKLLLPWRGRTLIEAVLAAWRASGVTAIIVVVHPDDVELAERCRAAGAEVVVPEGAPAEMKDSVAIGLDFISRQFAPAATDAWLLAPADMPGLDAAVIQQALAAYQTAERRIVIPVCAGRRGHPVVLPWSLAAEVGRLGPDEGINVIVSRHPVTELRCEDAGILSDVDTPADYRRLGGGDAGA